MLIVTFLILGVKVPSAFKDRDLEKSFQSPQIKYTELKNRIKFKFV